MAQLFPQAVPCEGSDIIGRCDNFLRLGIAEHVERVARVSFESTNAALAQDHLRISARQMYSALSSSSSMVAECRVSTVPASDLAERAQQVDSSACCARPPGGCPRREHHFDLRDCP